MNKLKDWLRSNISMLFPIIYGIGYSYLSQKDAFESKYLITEDAGFLTYWMFKLNEFNGFIENDLIYNFSVNIQPWGYYFIFKILSIITDPLLATKILIFPVSIFCFWVLFKLLRLFYNNKLSLSGVILITPIIKFSGLHPRAFAIPLLLAFLYFYSTEKKIYIYIVLIISSLIYPPICLLILLLFFTLEIHYCLKNKEKIQNLIKSLIIVIVPCFIILIKSFTISTNPKIGRMYKKSEIIKMVEFQTEYRSSLYRQIHKPLYPIYNQFTITFSKVLPKEIKKNEKIMLTLVKLKHNKLIQFVFYTISVIIILLFILFRNKKQRLMKIDIYTFYLLACGIILYFIANLLLFNLYIPNRYLKYSIPIFFLFVFIRVVYVFLNKQLKYILIFFLLLASYFLYNSVNLGLKDYSNYKQLYDAVKQIDGKVLIAGPPELCDQIPIFSQKSIFISRKTSNYFFKNYWETIKGRTYDFFDAYYTNNPVELVKFISNNNIDYIIVDKDYFLNKENLKYFEPFKSYIDSVLISRNDYYLLKTENHKITINEKLSLFDCGSFLKNNQFNINLLN